MKIVSGIVAIMAMVASLYYGPIMDEYSKASWLAVLALINWLIAQEDR